MGCGGWLASWWCRPGVMVLDTITWFLLPHNHHFPSCVVGHCGAGVFPGGVWWAARPVVVQASVHSGTILFVALAAPESSSLSSSFERSPRGQVGRWPSEVCVGSVARVWVDSNHQDRVWVVFGQAEMTENCQLALAGGT